MTPTPQVWLGSIVSLLTDDQADELLGIFDQMTRKASRMADLVVDVARHTVARFLVGDPAALAWAAVCMHLCDEWEFRGVVAGIVTPEA